MYLVTTVPGPSVQCFVCRENALDMFCRLHRADAYVTKDKERQKALADYTNKTTKQVRAVERGCSYAAHVSILKCSIVRGMCTQMAR